MIQSSAVELIFSKSYNLALEQSQTRHDLFVLDKAFFTAMFPGLANPFDPNWQLAITAADALPTDAAVDNESQILTGAVNQQSFLASNLLGELYAYVREGFSDPLIHKFFGADQYGPIGNNFLQLRELMQLAHTACGNVTYKPILIAAGFPQVQIDLIDTIQLAMWNTNRTQEAFKGGTPVKTEVRKIAFNTMWAFDQRVNNAADVVFATEYAKRQQYILYPERTSGSIQTISLNPNQTKQLDDNAAPADRYEIEVTGTEGVKFCVSATDDVDPCATGTSINAGATQQILISDLGSGTFFKATNASAVNPTSFKLKKL